MAKKPTKKPSRSKTVSELEYNRRGGRGKIPVLNTPRGRASARDANRATGNSSAPRRKH